MRPKFITTCIIGLNYGLNVIYPILKENKKIKILGVSSLRKKKLINNLNQFKNWKKMIKDCKPQFVIVATPPKLQNIILNYLIRNNIPFFAQKPLSYNYLSSKFIFNKIKKKKLISDLDLNFLQLKAIVKFRKIIKIKKIFNSKIDVRWFLNSRTLTNKKSWKNDEKKGGGLLYNFGFHLFSILIDYFGDLKLSSVMKKKNFYKLDFQDENNNSINVILSNNQNNRNLFEISLKNLVNNKYSIKNTSKNYHDNFRISKNRNVIFMQKNSKNPQISRGISSALILKNFIKNLKVKNKSISKNILLSMKIHNLIKLINEK
tara:strand:+ start:43 stop:996 length:954 start_codon:yes stop_codon:yes gene_type:complete